MALYLLEPAMKDYIWGGTRLYTRYGIGEKDRRAAEAWVLSCHPEGRSIVADGRYNNVPLADLLSANPALLGTKALTYSMFPVMIKLIDADQSSSIHVHPDDDYITGKGLGKGELWYVVDADPDSEIIYGFSSELTQDQLSRDLWESSLLPELNRVKVRKGDVFYLEPGTVHAVGKGVILAEIQENSNVIYRIFDFGRLDDNGQPRQMHIKEALDVAITAPPAPDGVGPEGEPVSMGDITATLLRNTEYFTCHLLEINGSGTVTVDETSFGALLCVEGSFEAASEEDVCTLSAGKCAFVPAGSGKVTLHGDGKLILTTI